MTTIPTISELKSAILANFDSEFGITVNPYGHAFLEALAAVLAMALWLCYMAIAATQKNIWYDTCDYETLIRFGLTILGRYPFAATKAEYEVTVTGSVGGVIPASTVFRSNNDSRNPGMLYQVTTATTLTTSPQNIFVKALKGGDSSSLAVADTMTSTTPLLNVNLIATVAVEQVDPENAEDMEIYRSKIGDKIRLTPGSWNAVDYRLVGTDVTGVGEVYTYGASATEVDVFVQGTVPVASPGPSASTTVINAYTAALEAVRPLPAFIINIASCPINDVTVTITMGSFAAFSVTQKATILAALKAFINGIKPFIAAADTVTERNDLIATYNLSTTISQAVPGYGFSSVTFTVAGTPTASWQADNGNIAFLTTVNYA